MKTPEELELEQLLAQLAPNETARAQLREEHRQLEKDLLRLADPMPPPDFVQRVMVKVAHSPARAPGGREVFLAGLIVLGALGGSAFAFSSTGGSVGLFGLQLTEVVLRLRETMIGLFSVLGAIWRTAALPLTAALSVTLAGCLLLFKRVVLNASTEVKVAS